MELRKLSLLIILTTSLLFSCKDEFDSTNSILQPSLNGQYLMVSQSSFNHASPLSFTDTFNVDCSEISWEFTTMPDWINISPFSGDSSSEIVLEGMENKSVNSRTSIFFLESKNSSWNFRRPLSVLQVGVENSLIVEPTELSLSGKGETTSVLIIANCLWNAKCAQEWVNLKIKDANELIITVGANPTDVYRETIVYINYGDNQTFSLPLVQFPSSISTSDTILKFENTASKYDIVVTSEMDWHTITLDNWIYVDPKSGTEGKTQVTIEVAPNNSINRRIGYIAFATGNHERFQVQIEQEGLFIETIDKLTFRSSENSQSFEIRSNTDWEILSYPEWLSFSINSGFGTTELTATVTENPNLDQREGIVKIGQRGLSLSCEIHVNQTGRTLSADTYLLEFTDKVEERKFRLLSDGNWSSTCSDNWFKATPMSGKGDETISVSVEENTNPNTRNGNISYTFGNQSIDVMIQQLGKYFNLNDQSLYFTSQGGQSIISLSTNESWTAYVLSNPEWVSVSSTSGIGDCEIILTVNDNPSVNPRYCELILKPEHSQEIRIPINQKGRYLRVSTRNVIFYATGGTSDFISIDTDGSYEISKNANWFKINKENQGFTITAEPYKQPETRSSSICIALTDLKEGTLSLEIPVIQIGEGVAFVIASYDTDVDWNDFGNAFINFSITGYTSDKNWNTQNESKLVITLTGFKDDEEWNTDEKEDFEFIMEDYSKDSDWNY